MYGTTTTILLAVAVAVVLGVLLPWLLIRLDRRDDTVGAWLDRQPECAVDGCDLKASARDRGRLVCHRHNRTGVALND